MLEKYYKNALEDAKNSLLEDGVIIVPTDTIYGLACLSSSKVAIDRIYDMKQRGRDKPLPLIVDTYDRLLKVADVDLNVVKKLSKYFPGPVTLVCKRNPDFDFFDAETVAVRMVNIPLVNKIIESVDAPLCLTSANLSNEENITDPMEIIELFDGYIDCVFLDGKCKNSESTIVKINDDNSLTLLREGKVKFENILKEYDNA
ncbi:MAG: threonylcarbamoyl-AMP synthase [Bacilli bacterium]|nr:threonylcarbamoyl-AMP synthase [Bacilli bacterium]